MSSGRTPGAIFTGIIASPTGTSDGLARSTGTCQLIHIRRPCGSPSGIRFKYGPHRRPIAANTSSGVSSATLPTKCTFAIAPPVRPKLFLHARRVIAELIEQRLVARNAAILEDAGPPAHRHLVLGDQRPHLVAALPGRRVEQRIGERHLHTQPIRAGAFPPFLEHRLLADRIAVLIEPLPIVEAGGRHDERVSFPARRRIAVVARKVM